MFLAIRQSKQGMKQSKCYPGAAAYVPIPHAPDWRPLVWNASERERSWTTNQKAYIQEGLTQEALSAFLFAFCRLAAVFMAEPWTCLAAPLILSAFLPVRSPEAD